MLDMLCYHSADATKKDSGEDIRGDEDAGTVLEVQECDNFIH
jgi:hypothetical protein